MPGRMDYEERRRARIDHLNDAAYKANTESDAAIKRSYNLTKDIPLGQPNIHGALTGVMNKSRSAADRSIKLADKADYYAKRAEAAENNTAISSDDPEAITKLKAKITALETERERVKAFNKAARKNGTEPAPWYTLPYIGKNIKRLKERIAKIEQVDQMPAEIITFDGGEIESDPITNRVIIRHGAKPDSAVIQALKSNGFHWSHTEQAWTRLRNLNALYAAKIICGIRKDKR